MGLAAELRRAWAETPGAWAARIFDGTVPRTAAAFALTTAVVVLAGSTINFWSARDLSRQKELAGMSLAAADEAGRLAARLGSFSGVIAALAADDAVAAAVVDSEGRNRHLTPVLRLLQPTLDLQFSQQPTSMHLRRASVAVLDHRGRWMLGSVNAAAGKVPDGPWIAQVMAGTPTAFVDNDQRTLYIAHPVVFAATGRPEGILVGMIELVDNAAPSQRATAWREALVPDRALAEILANPEATVVSRALPLLPPMEKVQLFLAVWTPNETLAADARAILGPHLALAIAGILAALLVGAAIARRTTRPLRHLALAAAGIDADQRAGVASFAAISAKGAKEVRLLGRALDDSLAALRQSNSYALLVKSALDAAGHGVVIVDARKADLPVTYANQAFEEVTGYAADEVVGRNLRFLHGRDGGQAALASLRQALRAGEATQVLLRNWRKDGTPFWNELSIAPVRDPDGQLTHFIGMQKDVSERMRAEEQLRASQRLESLGQLTGGLAHDFNNLLGIVIGNLDMLTEMLPEGSPERVRSDNALRAAVRGADVTRSLLAVARRQHLEPQEVDINGRLRDMLPLIENSVGRRVQVHAELGATPLHAKVDLGGLDAAVLNFTINARDAMAGAGGELRLRATELAIGEGAPSEDFPELSPGRYACIEVIDNGHGMTEEVRSHAFEPFFTTKGLGEGTGLGLSMVYGFARQSGGTAALRPAPGGGTVALLLLPLSAPEAPAG